ncbi:hypothetical protein PG989_016350 [Apiospora arundinis]
MMDFRQDMVFSTSLYWNYLKEFAFPPRLRNPRRSGGYVDHLRHLALPLFDFAYWPSVAQAESFTSPESSPNFCPWFKDGVLTLLRLARNLRTLHIVADRFFSTGDSYSAEHSTPTRDNLDPFRSNSRLRDVVAPLSRDNYGFVEYDAFVKITKYDWAISAMVLPRVILDGRYRSLSGLELTKVPFETYDPFLQKVLNLARAYSSHPLAMKPKETIVPLVVDFDANVGRHEFLSFSAERRNMTLKPTKI